MKIEKNTFLKDLEYRVTYDIFKTEYDILVVDDELSLRTILFKMLKEAGFSVETAEDGYSAFKKFLCHKYKLIVTDMNMPKMNGLETIKAVKKVDKDQLIIVLSGEHNVHLKKRALEAGADVFLTKPVDMNELLSVIGETIGKPHVKVRG